VLFDASLFTTAMRSDMLAPLLVVRDETKVDAEFFLQPLQFPPASPVALRFERGERFRLSSALSGWQTIAPRWPRAGAGRPRRLLGFLLSSRRARTSSTTAFTRSAIRSSRIVCMRTKLMFSPRVGVRKRLALKNWSRVRRWYGGWVVTKSAPSARRALGRYFKAVYHPQKRGLSAPDGLSA